MAFSEQRTNIKFLTSKNVLTVPHPPYSPDLAPCDYFLFPKLKKTRKGKRFQNIEDIKSSTTDILKSVSKEDFQQCFWRWQERWNKRVCAEGQYFEGD